MLHNAAAVKSPWLFIESALFWMSPWLSWAELIISFIVCKQMRLSDNWLAKTLIFSYLCSVHFKIRKTDTTCCVFPTIILVWVLLQFDTGYLTKLYVISDKGFRFFYSSILFGMLLLCKVVYPWVMIPAGYRMLSQKCCCCYIWDFLRVWDLIYDRCYLLEHLSVPFRLAKMTLGTFLNAWTQKCMINSLCLKYLNPLACQADISGWTGLQLQWDRSPALLHWPVRRHPHLCCRSQLPCPASPRGWRDLRNAPVRAFA